MPWTIVVDPAALDGALFLARGCYQRALLRGEHNLSGSSLRGEASRWGTHYKRSRESLLGRLTAAGVPWAEARGEHGKRVLVLGKAAEAVALLGGGPRAVATIAGVVS